LACKVLLLHQQGLDTTTPSGKAMRIVYPSPSACPCCGGALHKLGEDVTETLDLLPWNWKRARQQKAAA
jgi:hypothetical protein